MIYLDANVIIRLIEGTPTVRAPLEGRIHSCFQSAWRLPIDVPPQPPGMSLQAAEVGG